MVSISILQGIYNEHGLEELINRINYIINTNIKIDDPKTKVTYEDNCLTINCPNPITITIEDEVYKVTTHYKTYKSIRYYYNKELIRTLTAFYTADDQLLTVDHIDNGNFKSTRISKTTEEDKNYNQGTYEREISEYPDLPINISSHYIKGETEEDEERIIDIAGQNLYYHHYMGANGELFQESAMCIGKPYQKVTGHIRVPDDLLVTSIYKKDANIIIRGVNTDKQGETTDFYEVFFEFNEKGILVTDIIYNYVSGEIIRTKQQIQTKATSFTSTMIESIIRLINLNEVVQEVHKANVLEELMRLKETLLVRESKKTREINTIDLMMAIYPDSNYLALNIYENQEHYEGLINAELGEKNHIKAKNS